MMTLYLMIGWVILATFSRKLFISGLARSTGSTIAWGTSLAPTVLAAAAAAAAARAAAVPPVFPVVAVVAVPVVAPVAGGALVRELVRVAVDLAIFQNWLVLGNSANSVV